MYIRINFKNTFKNERACSDIKTDTADLDVSIATLPHENPK